MSHIQWVEVIKKSAEPISKKLRIGLNIMLLQYKNIIITESAFGNFSTSSSFLVIC